MKDTNTPLSVDKGSKNTLFYSSLRPIVRHTHIVMLHILFLIFPLIAVTTQAGSVYKCKQADGSIEYSNIACPKDTVNKEYMGEHTKRQASEGSGRLRSGDLRMLNNYESRYQHRSNVRHQPERIGSTQYKDQRKLEEKIGNRMYGGVVYTYEEAQKMALRDAGHRTYGNLTNIQRRRVDAEMYKYNHLPKSNPTRNDDQLYAEKEGLRMLKENRDASEVEQLYRTEKHLKDMGIWSRDSNYKRAVRDCRDTPGANCR